MKRFHVLSVLVCMLTLVSVNVIKAEDRKSDSIKPDTQAPVIRIKNEEDMIQIVQGNELKLKDYVAVSDNSDEFQLMSYGECKTEEIGEYTLNLVAIDGSGNASSKKVMVKVITQEEMDALIAAEEERLYQEELAREAARKAQKEKEAAALAVQREALASNSTSASGSAYDVALGYLGMGGWCTDVAQAFINGYFGGGYNIFDTYTVSAAEAQPGDIIYYSESGLGTQHYAVYLGGESALHGNWNGTTVIKGVYLKGGSEPQFRRLNGR